MGLLKLLGQSYIIEIDSILIPQWGGGIEISLTTSRKVAMLTNFRNSDFASSLVIKFVYFFQLIRKFIIRNQI